MEAGSYKSHTTGILFLSRIIQARQWAIYSKFRRIELRFCRSAYFAAREKPRGVHDSFCAINGLLADECCHLIQGLCILAQTDIL